MAYFGPGADARIWSKRDFWITRSFRSTPIWIGMTRRKWRSAVGHLDAYQAA